MQSLHYDIYCGVDVGKTEHYVVALGAVGEERLISRWVKQEEPDIRQAFSELAKLGKVLVTLDQIGNIGCLLVAVAQEMNIDVAHLPPRLFHKASELYGENKSDAGDAYVSADVSRAMPKLIRPVGIKDEVLVEMKYLLTRRNDITKEATVLYNRIHDLLLQICPPLELLFSKKELHSDLNLRLLEHYGGPDGFKRSGKKRVSKWAANLKHHKTRAQVLVSQIFDALNALTVHLAGTAVVEKHIQKMAKRLLEIKAEQTELEKQIAKRAELYPEIAILMSMPGIGIIYGATIFVEIGNISNFQSASHLASYAGLTPKREVSGSSVNKNKKAKGGNRRLKGAMVKSAGIAANCDAHANAYYEKKRAEGKKYKSALLALARRRTEVIYALLKTGSLYEPQANAA